MQYRDMPICVENLKYLGIFTFFVCFFRSSVYGKGFRPGRIHSGGVYAAKVECIRPNRMYAAKVECIRQDHEGRIHSAPPKRCWPNTLECIRQSSVCGQNRVYAAKTLKNTMKKHGLAECIRPGIECMRHTLYPVGRIHSIRKTYSEDLGIAPKHYTKPRQTLQSPDR